MIVLLVMTDGRDDLLARTLPVATAHVPHTRLLVHDDTGDYRHRLALSDQWRHLGAEVIGGDTRRGFGGAISAAWAHLERAVEPFVVHLEDDFILGRPFDWLDLADTLIRHPHLVQLALRRQPWNPAEIAAGGVIEQHPDDYTECRDAGGVWLEHTRFFTTNPSIYRRAMCAEGWPTGDRSEGVFTHRIRTNHPDWRFAYWGARSSGEWCEHIGHQRAGTGY